MKQHDLLWLSGQSHGACNRRHAANSRCHKTNTLTWCHCTFIESTSINNEANTLSEKHDSCRLWVISRHMHCTSPCPLYPNNDRESRHPQTLMSALPPKADSAVQLRMSALGQKRTS